MGMLGHFPGGDHLCKLFLEGDGDKNIKKFSFNCKMEFINFKLQVNSELQPSNKGISDAFSQRQVGLLDHLSDECKGFCAEMQRHWRG